MRYGNTCTHLADLAIRQSGLASKSPGSFLVGAMLGGAFVGIAMILALSVGAHLEPSVRPLAMGAVFGIAILLTLFGGGELFTGQTMFATFALLSGKLALPSAFRLLALSWAGNMAGAGLVSLLFALGGGGQVYGSGTLLHDLVGFKIHSPAMAILARAILCNWLACLGIWSAARLTSESGKMIVLSWCVAAYVTCGFDHSIANAALFALDAMSPGPAGDLAGMACSLGLVSLGNLLGGSVLVAGAYVIYSRGERPAADNSAAKLDLPHLPSTVRDRLAMLQASA